MKTPLLAAIALLAVIPAASAEPPKPTTSTDPAKCVWEWKSGGGVGIWAERCAFGTGVWEPMFRADLPGFALTVDGADEATILQLFKKPADAPISAILPELKKRGFIPDGDECVFEPATDIHPVPKTVALFVIKPTGSRLAAFDATPEDEVPEAPCGEYGWSAEGVRYFMTDIAHPDTVVYINIGQDGTMFDDKTVTLE